MSLSSLAFLLELPETVSSFVAVRLAKVFLSPSPFSLASLLSALCVAILYLAFRHGRRRKQIPFRVLLRAIFPRRLMWSASSKADIGYFFLNSFVTTALLGWAILSYHVVSTTANDMLATTFGARQPTSLSEGICVGLLTIALFIAYELSYWLDHYLSHKIPFLWEFHKVHHSAEVLSPLTNFRVHPVDTLVFYNITALVMGATGALVNYALGQATHQFTIANSNILTLAFFFLVGHLQHSHFWIAFPGVWGRLFLSPAHHQIHHSTNPVHFDKNLGLCLGIWDWLFGTLYVPGRKREKLSFGVEPKSRDAHTIAGALVTPVYRAFSHIKPALQQPNPAATRDAPGASSLQ